LFAGYGHVVTNIFVISKFASIHVFLQVDAVGLASEMVFGLYKLSGGVLAWFSLWGEVKICTW